MAMYLTRELTDLSLPRIGEYFGGKHHSTVLHGCNRIEEMADKRADIKEVIGTLRVEIESNTSTL